MKHIVLFHKYKLINENTIYDITSDDFVTDKYIQDVLMEDNNTERLVDDYVYQNDLDTNDIDYAEISGTHEFLDWCKEYLKFRFDKIKDDIEYCFNNGKIEIFREMTVSKHWFDRLKKVKDGRIKLGVYWSWDKHKAEAHWGGYNKGGYDRVLISALVKNEDIDWEQTFNMNMDLSLGELEAEITLKENVPLYINSLEIDNEKVDISELQNKKFLS